MTDKTCMSYWWPLIEKMPIQTPRTELKKTIELLGILDGPNVTQDVGDARQELEYWIMDAGERIGWPIFVRTGHSSQKWSWKDTCFVESRDQVSINVFRLVDGGLGDLPTDVWAVREVLPVTPYFHTFKGLPITKERRYMVRDGEVVDHFPYWPEDSIRAWGNTELPDNWRSLLSLANEETDREVKFLSHESEKVANEMPEYWSVDWMLSNRGWYLIDMAEGEKSWQPWMDREES